MKRSTNRTSLTAILILCLISMNSQAVNDISLKALNDTSHKLSEYIGHGKWTVLNIWGTRCPPCKEEIPELNNFHDFHKDKEAIVVGIAIDFPSYGYAKKDQVTAFAEDYLIDFTILLSDARVTEKMGLGRLEGLPTTYLFNPKGDVVGIQIGGITEKILDDFIKKYNLKNPELITE